MRVLITGSSGQIGTNLAVALLRRGVKVACVDIQDNKWRPGIHTEIIDLAVDDAFSRLLDLKRPDIVIHLAAHAKVNDSTIDPCLAFKNVAMLKSPLLLARHHQSALILASSREVYGETSRVPTKAKIGTWERAESPYAASKISTEAFARAFAHCYDLPCIIFRLSNVYGRYDNDLDRMTRVIPLFMHRILNELPISIFGKEKILDFTYVDDCVNGIVAAIDALRHRRLRAGRFDLGCGEGHSLLELVRHIERLSGKRAIAKIEPTRKGEVTHYIANISRAFRDLKYRPIVSLPQGLELAWDWSQRCSRAANDDVMEKRNDYFLARR